MLKKILLGLLFFLILAIIGIILFVYIRTRPSGNIDAYTQYEVNDRGDPVNDQVKVTFFGVSTLLFDDGETQVLFDGFFSRPTMFQALFTKIESDTASINHLVSAYKMDRVRGIFVTHSHYDHAFDVAYTTKRTGATLYGSVSTLNIARGGQVSENQLKLYEPGTDIQLGKFTIRVINSKHSPGNALKDDAVVIDKPLGQPAKMNDYAEGGSFDFYIRHNGKTIYVKPSPNYIEGALDSLRADVLFLGMATVTKQPVDWQEKYYQQTIGTLKPSLVIPVHWDNFFHPISDHLVMLPKFVNNGTKDFDYFISKTKSDHIDFRILQGTRSIILFK